MLPLRGVHATQLWKVRQTFLSYDGHTPFSLKNWSGWPPQVPLRRDEARVVLRQLVRREPILALVFPLQELGTFVQSVFPRRNWSQSYPCLSLFLCTCPCSLFFAGADIVRCGLLSFLLYFSLFLRIRFTTAHNHP